MHEVGRLCYPSLPNCILLHYFSHSDLDSRELRIGSYYVVLLFIIIINILSLLLLSYINTYIYRFLGIY